MKTLVTGAAGRLGSVVLARLQSSGRACRATDRLLPPPPIPADFPVADLLDREACYRLVEGVEALVHFGNIPNQRLGDFQTVLNRNQAMTANLFQAAAERGVSKFVYASSIQVQSGDRADATQPSELAYLPMDGALPPNPGTGYALSKVFGETLCRYYAKRRGIQCVALRIPYCSTRRREGLYDARKPELSPGDEGGLYLHPEDLARLVERVLDADLPGSRVYLPCDGVHRFEQSPEEVAALLYSNVPHKKPASQWTSLADLSAVVEETGWRPEEI